MLNHYIRKVAATGKLSVDREKKAAQDDAWIDKLKEAATKGKGVSRDEW